MQGRASRKGWCLMEQSQLATRWQGGRFRAVATAEAGEGTAALATTAGAAVLAGAPAAEPTGARPGGERPLVLVADDDPDVLDLVVARIEAMGFEVVAARDGGEALRLAVERSPEIAILDVAMPRLDGLEVTRRLRLRDPDDGTAVILMTARVADADVVRGFEAGAEDYIKKPFSLRELTEAVKRKQEQRALRSSEAATRRMAGEQTALREVATAVAGEATPREVFAQVSERAGTTLGADVGVVLRLGDTPMRRGWWACGGRRPVRAAARRAAARPAGFVARSARGPRPDRRGAARRPREPAGGRRPGPRRRRALGCRRARLRRGAVSPRGGGVPAALRGAGRAHDRERRRAAPARDARLRRRPDRAAQPARVQGAARDRGRGRAPP